MAKPTRLPLRGAAVVELLKRKWERELDYKLKKELDECVGDLALV
jgi:nuclear transport factor 2 (NTF2) superfamily protein